MRRSLWKFSAAFRTLVNVAGATLTSRNRVLRLGVRTGLRPSKSRRRKRFMLRTGATLHPHRSAIVMSGSPQWFRLLRVNAAGKHIGIRISRAVRGVRLTSSLVAARPRWGMREAAQLGEGGDRIFEESLAQLL